MRIVLVVNDFPKISETFIVSKFQHLLDRGWNVHIVCGNSSGDWTAFPALENRSDIHRRIHTAWPHRIKVIAAVLALPMLVWCAARNPIGTLRYLVLGWNTIGSDVLRRLYIDAEIVALKPDLIHFEFGPLAVDRIYLKEVLNCRVVVSFRGYDLNFVGLDNPNHYAEVWSRADELHLLGDDLWRRAVRRGCPAEKPHVLIPPAIDTGFFDPHERCHSECAGSWERPLRIVSIGRLEWKKGYEYGLQAVRLLRERGIECEYRIVGHGSYLEPLAYLRHALAVKETVHFLGALPRDRVREQLRWADVLLHAAVSEGFCNAVLEAQAMRLPVVSSDADGLAENVVNGVTGFVVPRRNPQALAEKLALLAGDPDLRQQMGVAGRDRVVAHFKLGDQIDAFDRLYRQVLHG